MTTSWPEENRCLPDSPINIVYFAAAAAAAKSLQSCPTLCDPIDGSPPGSPVPEILQARTLEWVAISLSNAWKWKVKGKLLVVSNSSRPHGLQPTRLLCPWDFPGKSTGVGRHRLLRLYTLGGGYSPTENPHVIVQRRRICILSSYTYQMPTLSQEPASLSSLKAAQPPPFTSLF